MFVAMWPVISLAMVARMVRCGPVPRWVPICGIRYDRNKFIRIRTGKWNLWKTILVLTTKTGINFNYSVSS